MGKALSVSGGGTPSTHNPEYWNGEIPWLTPAEVSGFSGRFIEKTERNISKKGLEHSSAKLMPAGSLLLTSRATIGDVVINKVPMATNQGFINIVPSNEVDQIFLFYWLKKNRYYFNQIAVGSTFPELIKSVFKEIEIELPELGDQKRIAEILSAFDDKIELNNKISRTLEQMAQAIFKEWFGEKSKFKNQNAKLWETKRLGDIMQFEYGKALKLEQRKSGNVAVVGSSGIVGWHNKKLVSGPGIVVGRKGTVGSIIWIDDDFYPIDTTFYVASDLSLYFCYFVLKRQKFITGDSAVPGLNRNTALSHEIVVPPKELIDEFGEQVKPLFQKMHNIKFENQKLAALRDLLLPKLMSGEIRV